MQLLRYGPVGQEKPGLLDANGYIRDLSGEIADVNGGALSPDTLARISKLDPAALPLVNGPRLGCPVANVGKFVAVGLNYADHAAESNMALPNEPIIFLKATSCIVGPNDDVMLPRGSTKSDWEVELGIVIGRTARAVEEAEAFDYVAGFCVVNDVSEREYQLGVAGAGTRARASTRSGQLGTSLLRRTKWGTPMHSTCGSTSTGLACRQGIRGR